MNRELFPAIITASRATDIPAYYGEWFVNRLRAGYCHWVNPFNREVSRVSFEKTRAIVFWTKNAVPFLKQLPAVDAAGKGYYFTYSLNDYDSEKWEPNIPAFAARIENFCELSEKLGADRVVWRFDPLILSADLDIDGLLERIERIGAHVHRYTRKLIVSFVDIAAYKKVQRNLNVLNRGIREFSPEETTKILSGIGKFADKWCIKAATCSESGNYLQYGIEPASCVDGALLRKLYPHDKDLLEYLSPPRAKNIFTGEYDSVNVAMKDRGQRINCGCVVSKDIGYYDSCPAGCVYCYANSTKAKINNNIAKYDPNGECLIVQKK
ncbi:MAG: DUF1848 domain-containing protein [Negativicutes bacterium]